MGLDVATAKRRLVGTGIGRFSARARDLYELIRSVLSNPEQGGTLCQEICAKTLLPELCCPLTTFIDIGAHIGSVIAEIRRNHPSMPVIAIEADPEKAANLARRFPDVEVHSCAVGESDKQVTLFVDTLRSGYSSVFRGRSAPDTVREVAVEMKRLDDIIPETTKVGFIKMDVEGGELSCLRGAPQTISRCRPVVLFESAPRIGETQKFPIEELYDWFAETRYEVFVPNRVAHNGPALSRDGFVDAHEYPFRTLNYFAIPEERRIEVRDQARRALGIRDTS
jgi:FkbM family methyltransferase